MNKRGCLLVTLLVFLVSIMPFGIVKNVNGLYMSDVAIYIRADGSVEPALAPVVSEDNRTYLLNDDVLFSSQVEYGLVIERNDTVFDGQGHALSNGTSSYGTGVTLNTVENVMVRNLSVHGFVTGVSVYASTANIEDCNFTGNAGNGVWLSNSALTNVTGSNLSGNVQSGIRALSLSECRISGNVLENNGQGLWLEQSSLNNSIFDNVFRKNSNTGVQIQSCSNVAFMGNRITSSGAFGLAMANSKNNTVVGNRIDGQRNPTYGFGIELATNSANNTFYHNDFVNNTQHVYIYPSANYTNIWDNGYPSGGNYWDTYLESDIYSGPSQNETGSDGIIDLPYYFFNESRQNVDRYPLSQEYQIPELGLSTVALVLSASSIICLLATWKRRQKKLRHVLNMRSRFLLHFLGLIVYCGSRHCDDG